MFLYEINDNEINDDETNVHQRSGARLFKACSVHWQAGRGWARVRPSTLQRLFNWLTFDPNNYFTKAGLHLLPPGRDKKPIQTSGSFSAWLRRPFECSCRALSSSVHPLREDRQQQSSEVYGGTVLLVGFCGWCMNWIKHLMHTLPLVEKVHVRSS